MVHSVYKTKISGFLILRPLQHFTHNVQGAAALLVRSVSYPVMRVVAGRDARSERQRRILQSTGVCTLITLYTAHRLLSPSSCVASTRCNNQSIKQSIELFKVTPSGENHCKDHIVGGSNSKI